MRDTYSLYEAKSKLSAIVRQVREGHPVVVTLHGEPVVEIRALVAEQQGLNAKLDQMVDRGVLVRPKGPRPEFRSVAQRPGALKRFLDDRGE
jgi:antitoxin (DNA-binding transcriptional repressor) of toxin-antitoxin stability system